MVTQGENTLALMGSMAQADGGQSPVNLHMH
jgi:hypothetical protein